MQWACRMPERSNAHIAEPWCSHPTQPVARALYAVPLSAYTMLTTRQSRPAPKAKHMPSGRISDYTPELVEAAWNYANGGWERAHDPIPSVAGLACEIGISRETCYAWAKDETKVFSDILNVIAKGQERQLLRGGLSGGFNSSITKMILTKHGYSDRIETDHTSSDGSMTPQTVERVIVKAENTDR